MSNVATVLNGSDHPVRALYDSIPHYVFAERDLMATLTAPRDCGRRSEERIVRRPEIYVKGCRAVAKRGDTRADGHANSIRRQGMQGPFERLTDALGQQKASCGVVFGRNVTSAT
jgi:hypothetical protein